MSFEGVVGKFTADEEEGPNYKALYSYAGAWICMADLHVDR